MTMLVRPSCVHRIAIQCKQTRGAYKVADRGLRIRCLSASSSDQIPFYGAPRPPSSVDSSSLLQRLAVAVKAATTALADPTRADAVAALGEVTGRVALQSMRDTMRNDPTGQQILLDRPIVSKETLPVDIEELLAAVSSSDGVDESSVTFGQAYGAFLRGHGFDPDDRSEIKYIEDDELAYIMLRYRQCHDYWHVLTGLPPTVLGELGLKWLELLQTGLPVAALSATVGSLKLDEKERTFLNQHYLPWAVRMSKQSSYLLNVYYEKEFDTPLMELRERLCIEPAPKSSA
jgi:ubiquinone biosynthesis protein COQ4